MKKTSKKVIVAMSGGVDSSVAAAMLKKEGYEVAGVFMHFWSEMAMTTDYGLRTTAQNTNGCCSAEAEMIARAVAAKLKIPFYVFHFEEEFKKQVVDYFLAEEAAGRTPNPCVVCNKKIKFGLMFDRAIALGADYIATGHYARRVVIASGTERVGSRNLFRKSKTSLGVQEKHIALETGTCFGNPRQVLASKKNISRWKPELVSEIQDKSWRPGCDIGGEGRRGTYKLFAAKDANKDQSYFLYNLTQEKLARILFPLGDYLKSEVYALAKKWRLPYRQDESFDICFAGDSLDNFLKKYVETRKGNIYQFNSPRPPLESRGGEKKPLGEHDGLPLYTIGQRKRLMLAQGPWFVAGKDEKKNILFVTKDEKDLYSDEAIVSQINWLGGVQPELPMKAFVKIRYKSEAAASFVIASPARAGRGNPVDGGNKNGIASSPRYCGAPRNDTLKVIFNNPQRAITAGQSAVFYSKKGELLGGGVID